MKTRTGGTTHPSPKKEKRGWQSVSTDGLEDEAVIEGGADTKGICLEVIALLATLLIGACAVVLLCSFCVGRSRHEPDTDWMMETPAAHQPNLCKDACVLSIVESIPQNLTYDKEAYIHRSTYSGLKELLSLAKESVHIASFYWTLLGTDIAYHDSSSKEGEDIFYTLMEMGKDKKVSIKIAQNAENNDTMMLAEKANAQVRTLNFTNLLGKGILHTKFWVVDGRHFYIGSANLDWRSLTQVKELGVLVQDCPCLGGDVEKLFDVYWYLGASLHVELSSSVLPEWFWPVIDDALREVAFDKGVHVRLLASKWSHTLKDMYAFLCSLSMLGHTHYPKMRVEVKLFVVPKYSKSQERIPYARVNHNKYMVTDQHAYIGTSNWSGDYFINTGGVGFILEQPEDSMNTTRGNFRRQLADIFWRDWYSNHSIPLPCMFNLTESVEFDV
ncbi:hypothetical protein BaRGS_00035857 [Batillaria attramentaria]|uniref:PLD phosphodiesterase domain-containing protein n=1 Tax=Batillaria attramentaria TaxID=370345 RepID=A0ABD0JDL0_9CAEN